MAVQEITDGILKQFEEESSALNDLADLQAIQNLKVRFLGKKGLVTGLMKEMGSLSKEERPAFGKEVNILRGKIESKIEEIQAQGQSLKMQKELESGYVDVTQYAQGVAPGATHPLNDVRNKIVDFFYGMGFTIRDGREIETDYYNFEALNMPEHHPARDMQDTFYVSDDVVLRTQTSGVQIHVMENNEPPLRIISPGSVFRKDSDASHSPMFHQIEGLVVDEDISFAHLKGTMYLMAQHLFGKDAKIRFRPSYFPFTEPSAEIDVSCHLCSGKGCKVCGHCGWIEIGGCGSVNPAVFDKVGIDSEKYTGFAFGMGIDRIAMIMYGIPEIGLIFGNDNRFLRQF